jgi:hypothetical protein
MSRKREGGIEVPIPFSLLFLPFLFAAGLISIPFSMVYRRGEQRRRKQFETQMKAKGRFIAWDQFQRVFEAGEGTVIEERHSFKRVRCWWTPDAVRSLSPYAIPDWFETMSARVHNPFSVWCDSQYTNPENGRAFLIGSRPLKPSKGSSEMWRQHRLAEERWIFMVPLELLKKSQPESIRQIR